MRQIHDPEGGGRTDAPDQATRALLVAAQDRFRTVRIPAAASLLGRNLAGYSAEQRAAYEKAHAEYWSSLVIWPDRWSTHYNQGIYFDRLGDSDKALEHAKLAL